MNVAERTLDDVMLALGADARAAAMILANASTEVKNAALGKMAAHLRDQEAAIIAANEGDVARAKDDKRNAAFIDRLRLNHERIEAMAKGLEDIAALPDPVGAVMAHWQQPNGLDFTRVRVPLGVIGIIYESRPNVTADAGGLCMKSGNAAILRGGSDGFVTAKIIVGCLQEGLAEAGLPRTAIQMVPTADRAAVGALLAGLNGQLDLIVPRGGRSLVERVQREARVPVFAHLEGICHVYIDQAADSSMATAVTRNAKMRRTGICGAAEAVLIDRAGFSQHAQPVIEALLQAGCEVRGDQDIAALDARVKVAQDDDWGQEFLAPIVAMRLVDGVDGAMAHIALYGSQHTDCIITEDIETAERFLKQVDSAIVMHNTSTQFADGGEFGFGAEIGIATGKLHARGPVGLEQLTTFKYQLRGNGQLRP